MPTNGATMQATTEPTFKDTIRCAICNADVHVIEKHLAREHRSISLTQYQTDYPDHPVMSPYAAHMLKQRLGELAQQSNMNRANPQASQVLTAAYDGIAPFKAARRPLNEVFELPNGQGLGSSGGPIPITVLEQSHHAEMVPAISREYVFEVDDLKAVTLGLEMNKPTYVYGHKGTGKTELIEQVAARTGRPLVRVQHTINTEESHIVGQYLLKNGHTEFSLGPLPFAMLNGLIYLADEYDFALPSVTATYQPVLEGKALFIKEAPENMRIIKPHPNFRFIATGNTNGSGDESGLYAGTNIQNAANYDRFALMIHKHYMKKADEQRIIEQRTGLSAEHAQKMVTFATYVREAFDSGKIADTLSVRTLINASQVGIAFGSFRLGIKLAFSNKLSSVDKKVVDDIAARVFA